MCFQSIRSQSLLGHSRTFYLNWVSFCSQLHQTKTTDAVNRSLASHLQHPPQPSLHTSQPPPSLLQLIANLGTVLSSPPSFLCFLHSLHLPHLQRHQLILQILDLVPLRRYRSPQERYLVI